jgi:hypothetical protein
MFSCKETPEEAAQEAKALGAKRLLIVERQGVKEVAL